MAKKKKQTKKPAKAVKAKKEPAKDPSKPLPKIERFQRPLRVELTDEEVADASLRAAEALSEHDGKTESLKAANEHAKAQIKDLAAEFRRLSNQVRERAITRPVECERTYDFESKKITDKRCDTGEILFERVMTEAESQVDLPFRDIDDDFDDLGDPGEGIGDASQPPPKSAPKAKKPKPGKPDEKPLEEPKGLDETEDDEEKDDESPEAAE